MSAQVLKNRWFALASYHQHGLSPRLRELLVLWAIGFDNIAVAEHWSVELTTVRTHAMRAKTLACPPEFSASTHLAAVWAIAHARCCLASEWKSLVDVIPSDDTVHHSDEGIR